MEFNIFKGTKGFLSTREYMLRYSHLICGNNYASKLVSLSKRLSNVLAHRSRVTVPIGLSIADSIHQLVLVLATGGFCFKKHLCVCHSNKENLKLYVV